MPRYDASMNCGTRWTSDGYFLTNVSYRSSADCPQCIHDTIRRCGGLSLQTGAIRRRDTGNASDRIFVRGPIEDE